MKESEKCFGEQFKIAKEYSKKFKEMFSGYYSVREFVTENLSGNPSKVKEKYNKLRKEEQNQQDQQGSSNQQQSSNLVSIDEQEKNALQKAFDDSIVGGATNKMSTEFSDGLADMIRGYRNFSDVMKDMTNSLMNYMLKSVTDSIAKMIFNQNTAGGLMNAGGGIFDTLLGGGTSPVVFNNFNIKAWDSKDVQRYLLENKQLLNSITYEGIKNNNCHLRHMVQNA